MIATGHIPARRLNRCAVQAERDQARGDRTRTATARATARSRHFPAAGHPWPAPARSRCPTHVRALPPVNITWRYANRRAVTALAQTASASRADAGKRRASAALRITHVHVGGRPGAARRGQRGPTLRRTIARTSLCAWLRTHRELRVDTHHRFVQCHGHAPARVLRTPTKLRARYAPTLGTCPSAGGSA